MKNAGYYSVMAMALVMLLSPTVQADTLELRDGRLIEGTYAGGTCNTLRIQIEDRVDVFQIKEVLALTIDSGVTSFTRADGLTMIRWPSVAYASSFTSSGVAKSRPSSSARAWHVRYNASDPRGEAPR